ncbi:MAG TPA: DUF3298 domain-containing protein [Mucilaginibacter sp.]
MKRSGLAILLIAAVCSSCMWGKPAKHEPDVVKDTLAYKYTQFKERAPDCGDKADSACTVIKYSYPVFTAAKSLNDTIKSHLLNLFQVGEKPDTSLKALSKTLIGQYMDERKDRPDVFYTVDVKAKVIRQDSSLTLVEVSGYGYTGGAHGGFYKGFVNWNSKSGKVLKLDDVMATGNLSKLTAVAEKIFRKNENLSDTTSLANNYFFKDDKFGLANEYAINPTGILFFYNEYEIKPYAAGTTELLVPYNQIKSLLRPHTVVSQYVK